MWQRAMVTGASSGIGEAICRRLAAEGTDLILVARNKARLDELAEELRDRHRVDVDVLAADLADPAQLALVERRVAAEDEPVDLLVNNAGFGLGGTFGEAPVERHEAMIQVMVTAPLRLTHAALGRMRRAPRPRGRFGRRRPVGGILFISSLASFQPGPPGATYAACKAFITNLGEALHLDARRDGVVVTTVCPGLTRSGFHIHAEMDVSMYPDWLWQTSEEVARSALAAVRSRRAVVVPGLSNKVVQVGMRLLPLAVAREVAGAGLMRPDD